jgi:L-cysteine desulfidase
LRLKSFITSQARNDIAYFSILHGLENVSRIQTDSVSFSKDINNDDENYSKEDKSTGLIEFYNVNKYINHATGYKSKNFKVDDEDDYEINDDDE